MLLPFKCPHCGAQTEASDEYVGQTGPCAQCGKPITAPLSSAPVQHAMPPKSSSKGPMQVIVWVGVMVVCGGLLVMLLLPAIQAIRVPSHPPFCQNNMKQLSLAMQVYHETHGKFPPAYTTDEDGSPLHSWRVLLLPCLEEDDLYERIDLKQPWDSPHNRAFADEMPHAFRCPDSTATKGSANTSYTMIVGPNTISDGPTATSIDTDITDGASSTLALVEVADSGINWMEPRDLDARTISFAVNDGTSPGISSPHSDCANVAMCDGSVHAICDTVSPSEMKAMSTIDGGEALTGEAFD